MEYIKYSPNRKFSPDFKWLHDNCSRKTGARPDEAKNGLTIKRLSPLVKFPDTADDNVYDIYAHGYYSVYPNETVELSTGLKIALPFDFIAIIFDLERNLSNIINCRYKSEIKIRWINLTGYIIHIRPREKIGELVFLKNPKYHIQEI